MYGKVHAKIFSQAKHLLHGVFIKLRFVRNPDKFCIMCANDAKVVLKSMSLFIRKVHII